MTHDDDLCVRAGTPGHLPSAAQVEASARAGNRSRIPVATVAGRKCCCWAPEDDCPACSGELMDELAETLSPRAFQRVVGEVAYRRYMGDDEVEPGLIAREKEAAA